MLPIKLCAATKNRLLEVDFLVIVYSGEQLFHLLLTGLAGVGAGAGVGDGVLGDLGQTLEEHILRHKTLLSGVGVRAVVLDAVGDVQRVVHAAQVLDEQLDLFTDYAAEEEKQKAEDAALERERKIQAATLAIKKKYGKNAILKAMNLEEGATAKDRNAQIGGHKA